MHLSESLHFGRTARSFRLSPSSLTRAVQRLEQELSVTLLERDRRQVRLTAAGEKLQRVARQQLHAWQALKEELRPGETSPAGSLRIACTVTACHSLLPRLVARCRSLYPDIALELATQNAAQAMRQLEAAEVDFAVVPLPDRLVANLSSIALGSTRLVFIAPRREPRWLRLLRQSPIPWSEIPLVAPSGGVERQRLEAWLATLEARPRIDTRVGGNEGILSMVSLGCGIGLVPELVLERSPQRGEVVPIESLAPPPGYVVALCVQRRSLKRAAVAALWELARQPPATEPGSRSVSSPPAAASPSIPRRATNVDDPTAVEPLEEVDNQTPDAQY